MTDIATSGTTSYRDGYDAAKRDAELIAKAEMTCGCGRADCYTDRIPEAIAESIRALNPDPPVSK